MRLFILVCYLVITVFMIAVILFQRSEASAGLGGGTMGGMMTARGTANLLTRLTAFLATLFMGANLLLAYLEKQEVNKGKIREMPSLVEPAQKTDFSSNSAENAQLQDFQKADEGTKS